ncbi:hypothetical protein [Bosea sp. UC22_33]|uniref:hypothetical protein n=1 Tax=Bosea sp. UC22_33 TaxID=3350165 RepID=UPI00366E0629
MTRYGGCGAGQGASGVIPFVPGSEIVQPFLILAESTIVDIRGGTVTAEVLAYGVEAFAPAVEIEDNAPPVDADQQPHGVVRITEEQSSAIPDGALLRVIYTQDGVTMPALAWLMKRVA